MRPYHLIRTVPTSAREPLGSIAASANSAAKPSPECVRAQLDKIMASNAFAGAERPGRFLRFVVEQALGGNQLKETLLEVEVFGRNPSYDPRLDGVVRVEAVKLRSRLKEYYETEGAGDPLRIDLPKGGYLPSFEALPSQPAETVAAPPGRMWWTDWRVIVPPVCPLAVLIAGYLLVRKSHPGPWPPCWKGVCKDPAAVGGLLHLAGGVWLVRSAAGHAASAPGRQPCAKTG